MSDLSINCTKCGRPMAVCNGDCDCHPKPVRACPCEDAVNACLARGKMPNCENKAYIPWITLPNLDAAKNVFNSLVQISENNTLYYIGCDQRVTKLVANPVEIDNYDLENNPNNLRSQFVIDFANNRGAYYNETGEYQIFYFGEHGGGDDPIVITIDAENGEGTYTSNYSYEQILSLYSRGVPIYVTGIETDTTGEVPYTTAFGNYATSAGMRRHYTGDPPVGENMFTVATFGTYHSGGQGQTASHWRPIEAEIALRPDGTIVMRYTEMMTERSAEEFYMHKIDEWRVLSPVFTRGISYTSFTGDPLVYITSTECKEAAWGEVPEGGLQLHQGMRCTIAAQGTSSSSQQSKAMGLAIDNGTSYPIRAPIYKQVKNPRLSSSSPAPLLYGDIPNTNSSQVMLDLVYVDNGVQSSWVVLNI